MYFTLSLDLGYEESEIMLLSREDLYELFPEREMLFKRKKLLKFIKEVYIYISMLISNTSCLFQVLLELCGCIHISLNKRLPSNRHTLNSVNF